MNKRALFIVFLVVMVDLIGFGIVLPLLPFYASKFNASPLTIGLLYSLYSLAQLIFSPFWGGLSDRFGRRPIMLVSTFGSFLAYLLFAFSNSLPVLFFSRLIAGVMGGNISAAQAYVADVTRPEERARGMGLIGAAFGIGFMLGPALSGFLIIWGHRFSENRFLLPGLFAAFLSALSFILVLFKLPETVNLADNQKDKKEGALNKAGIFTKAFWSKIREENLRSAKHILPLLLLMMFLLSFGQSSLYSAFPLFCERVLGFGAEKVSLQFGLMGLIAVFVQGYLIRHLVKKFSEEKLFFFGSILMTLGLALIPWAHSGATLTFYLCLMTFGVSLNGPTLNSLISKEVDPLKMGAAMGTSQSFAALGRVVGPSWGGFLFGFSFKAPFMVTAFILLSTILFGLRLIKSQSTLTVS